MKKSIIAIIIIAILAAIYFGMQPAVPSSSATMPTGSIPFGTDPSLVGGDAVPTSGEENVQISAVGTEPFWGFAYQGGRLIWTMPKADEIGDMQETSIDIGYAGNTGNTKVTLRGLGESTFGAQITKETCSDGMSDNVYTHKVQAMFKGREYRGCANVEKL